MYPYILIGSSQLPTYFLCAVLGFSLSTLLATFLLFERRIFNKYLSCCLISVLGLLFWGRWFGLVSRCLNDLYYYGSFDVDKCTKQSGIVYLGGLLGYLFVLWAMCQFGNRNFKEVGNVIAVVIPLFHAVGRIGCFFGGCCYGIKSSSIFAVPYRLDFDSEFVNRIPIQLYEAAFELIAFLIIFVIYRKKLKQNTVQDGRLLNGYLNVYCIYRLFAEFLRGDAERGVYGWFSFTQIICCIILFLSLLRCIVRRKIKSKISDLQRVV